MVAYSFQPRFVQAILAGTKAQTIRGARRRHARRGDMVQLYSGQRSRDCILLGEAPCIAADSVRLEFYPANFLPRIWVNDQRINIVEHNTFAQADGFEDIHDMQRFWLAKHGNGPFVGTIIRWTPLAAAG